ncbi:MAG: GHKL domain-containing protein [Lachnospiraceae bacterium]|nr:GHKL domain-containing protein [Lachnospiraceae bacterium]
MNEADFTLFQNSIEGIEVILYACILAAFFRPFMDGKKGWNPQKAVKMLIVFFSYAAVYFMNIAAGLDGWACMVIVTALLTAAARYLGIDRKSTFLFGVLFFSIRNLGSLAVASVNFYTGRHLVQGEEGIEKILRNAALNFCLVELLQLILFSALLYIAGYQLKKCRLELHIRELCYLLLTPLTGLLFVNIIFRILVMVSEDRVIQLYEQYPVLVGIVPVVAALFYAGILATIVSYRKMVGLQEEKKRYFVQQQQVHAIQERMEEVEQFYDGIRRMKHEMKNHLTNIRGLYESGSFGEMEQYLKKMDGSMDVFELAVRTGNPVTDVIVNDRQKAAEKQGVQFRSAFIYPKSERYNAYDIGIIINNLLQNALEACGRMSSGDRYVSISSRQKKKFFLIEVRNSYEGEIVMDTDTDLPVSTKGDGTSGFLHGMGLSNVKREAEKYMGDVDIKIKKNEFSVTVLLQERRQT